MSDERERARVLKATHRDKHEVWRSGGVLYLLPAMAEIKAPNRAQAQPRLTAGER